jgi:hypothetical protein
LNPHSNRLIIEQLFYISNGLAKGWLMVDSIGGRVKQTQTYGNHGLRFAGPDLLDYVMIFLIKGGDFDGERLRVDSHYHPMLRDAGDQCKPDECLQTLEK